MKKLKLTSTEALAGKQKTKILKVARTVYLGLFLTFANTQAVFAQWDKSNYDATQLPRTPLFEIILNIARWLLAIFGFIAIIGFVISGIMYLVAAGDEDTQARAKRAMIYSITGVIVGLAGLIVIYAADYLLRGQVF